MPWTGGELCSMDSMQIYREMDIGTAKPTRDEQKLVPHHLIDMIDPRESYNTALYRNTALECIRDCLGRGVLPVFCGGTGQYASALAEGIAFAPVEIDPDLHDSLLMESEEREFRPFMMNWYPSIPTQPQKYTPTTRRE
jgi:tRNA dimethylallyltransferase